MTRHELRIAFNPVVELVRDLNSDHDLLLECEGDFGFTLGVSANNRAVEAHAWSWDGAFDAEKIKSFFESAPQHSVMHLSSPERPDHSGL